MYANLSKTYAFPMAAKVSSKLRCLNELQSLPAGSCVKTPQSLSYGFNRKSSRNFSIVRSLKMSSASNGDPLEMGVIVRIRSSTNGFRFREAVPFCPVVKGRAFSSSYSQKGGIGSGRVRARKTLPWLASNMAKESIKSEKGATKYNSRSSWQKSAKKSVKTDEKTASSSWEVAAKTVTGRNGKLASGDHDSGNRLMDKVENDHNNYMEKDEMMGVEEENQEVEDVDDPRWDDIKSKVRKVADVRVGSERPEFRRWNKQESWGRKTWKEATESSVPKMVGEGIYGVGPVLAALSAERREFYALYIQEGLDLSSNNRKKKDKKGFEKVLRIAEKIGLNIKETSKHDLNMVADNRPHQGLVLDASPLEMVKVKELDPVTNDDKGSLWVALDEVTDPQNLGAIIRSAYFFGASGVVLCAKNSAPLSGVVSKASAGSLELMELRYCKNMMQFLASSAENGWRVIGGSVSSKAVPLDEIPPGDPTILVLGSEGTGLRPLVERSCTHLVRIPGNMPADITAGADDLETAENTSGSSGEEFRSFLAVESLNVSVAAGVLLHHLIGNNYKHSAS